MYACKSRSANKDVETRISKQLLQTTVEVHYITHTLKVETHRGVRWFGHLVREKRTQKGEMVWTPGEREGNTEG